MNFLEDGRTNRLKSGIIPLVILTLFLSVSVSILNPCTYAAEQGRDSEEPIWIGVGHIPYGGWDLLSFYSTTVGEAVYECMCGSDDEICDWQFTVKVNDIRRVSEGDHHCGCQDFLAGRFNIYSVDELLRLRVQINCDEDCGIWVRIYMPPQAEFQAVPISGPEPLVVQFENLSQGYYSSLEWHFGDGTTSSAENPTHTYESAGDYTVTLTAWGRYIDEWDYIQSSIETKEDYIHVVGGMIGDVNNDGMITASDAQLCFQIILGLYSPTPGEEYRADANEDGQVTSNDAQIIFQQSLQ
ncbi:PKD domain-containing protein [bacterium]|nr:PKD domain-containing protein [bacterium]